MTSSVLKIKSVGSHRAGKRVSPPVLLCNVDQEPFAPQEITWPSVLVRLACTRVIPMELKDVRKSIAWKMMIAPRTSIVTDFLIPAWMYAKLEFAETLPSAPWKIIATDAHAHQDFNLTLHPK